MEYRYDIQGLRALAVLLVFIFHLNSAYLSGGFVGVDIFFVISGYLVSKIVLNNINSEQRSFRFLDFYLGRFRRLLPVYLVFLIITTVVGTFIYLSIDINTLRKNVFWSAIFNSNYFLATLDDYFGAKSSENPLLHTWTLSIEMQFYFLLPIYLKVVKREFLLSFTILIVLLLLGYSYYNSTFLDNKNTMYFSLLSRIPEFLIGVVFALTGKILVNKYGKYGDFFVGVAFLLILFSSIFFSKTLNFPGIIVLIPCIATGLILCFKDSLFNQKILSNKFLVHIGEISYSVYLWHWVIMAFLRYYNNRYSFTFWESFLIVIVTYLLSITSYKFIEIKYRKIANKKAFVIYGISFLILGSVFFLSPRLNRDVLAIPERFSSPTFGLESHGASFKKVQYIGNIQISTDSILLIGDSHALVYKSILDEIGKQNRLNFRTITNDKYPNIPGIQRRDFSNLKLFNQYEKLIKITNEEVEKCKLIIVSSVWKDEIQTLSSALENFVKTHPNKEIIILSDFPTVDKNPIKINRGFLKKDLMENKYNVFLKTLPMYVEDISEKYNNVRIMNLRYENGTKIVPFNKDTIMYYDEGHLNDYGARIIAKDIEDDVVLKIKTLMK
ncbi:acyltransferase family protein [Sphingobacterium sp. GVS05A]|uniref:acyltransferase family protein n=1 Tax=Sphingobacterium sp. GVS05A TaxID=2862679 RepID=UPI001CBFDADC|nr:acyltransferase family protein [Sphingobacterium sp. GVS05A]